jgi:bifunctional non-homologous end joining protein LigD
VHDEKTGALRYAGNVGTGFDQETLRSIKTKLEALATDKAPLPAPRGVKGHWVRPKLVAEVAFTEWTGDGRVRHPVFHGLRSDKDPDVITREKPQHAPSSKGLPSSKGKSATVAGIKVSHGDRVIDASAGHTKLDLVRYYDAIAEHILPHLAGRPATLVRAPRGHRRAALLPETRRRPADSRRARVSRALWPGHDPMIEIATREALVGAAQMNVVEFHTSNVSIARGAKSAGKPDRLVFDLDPGEGITWPRLLEATALMKKMLDLLELESFLKTSGGKGLHVVVPMKPAWAGTKRKTFPKRWSRTWRARSRSSSSRRAVRRTASAASSSTTCATASWPRRSLPSRHAPAPGWAYRCRSRGTSSRA